jgi:hypothetical protein
MERIRELYISPKHSGKSTRCFQKAVELGDALIVTPTKEAADSYNRIIDIYKQIMPVTTYFNEHGNISLEVGESKIDIIGFTGQVSLGKIRNLILDDPFDIEDWDTFEKIFLPVAYNKRIIAHGTADKMYSYNHLKAVCFLRRYKHLIPQKHLQDTQEFDNIFRWFEPEEIKLHSIRKLDDCAERLKKCRSRKDIAEVMIQYHGNPFIDRKIKKSEFDKVREL